MKLPMYRCVAHISMAMATFIVVIGLTGCEHFRSSTPGQQPARVHDSGMVEDPELLTAELGEFLTSIKNRLDETFKELEGKELTSDQRRALEDWKTRLPARFEQAFTEEYAANALARVWLLSKRLDDYLQEGAPGGSRFGEHQGLIRDSIRSIRNEAEGISRRHLPPAEFQRARAEIEELAEETALQGPISEDPVQIFGNELRASLGFLTSVPMIPFRTVEGISRGAGGFTDLPSAISEMARVIDNLPKNTREQAEIFYATVEKSDMATTTITSLERLTEVSERIAYMAEVLPPLLEALPGEISKELIRTLEETGAAQEELRETLREARRTLEEGRETLQAAEKFSEGGADMFLALATASDSLDKTAASATGLMESIGDLRPDKPRDPDAPRFDINEYTNALMELTLTSADLRETLNAVEALADRDDLIERRTATVRAETDDFLESQFNRANELVDRVFTRLMQLLLLIFALVVILILLRMTLFRGNKTT
ncbi:MAG: hypothetical protein JJU11_07115 [Candidatus Sumerlaeia bacterium]|nr:hypothetical protein [Candidatus Sumerlaeia bacterium]